MVGKCQKCGKETPWGLCEECYLKDSDVDKEPRMEFWYPPYYAMGSFGEIPQKPKEE